MEPAGIVPANGPRCRLPAVKSSHNPNCVTVAGVNLMVSGERLVNFLGENPSVMVKTLHLSWHTTAFFAFAGIAVARRWCARRLFILEELFVIPAGFAALRHGCGLLSCDNFSVRRLFR